MYTAVHSTIGAALATTSDNLGVAFLVGVVSHFLFDLVPHGDTRSFEVLGWKYKESGSKKDHDRLTAWTILIDAAISILVVTTVLFRADAHPYLVAAGIVGGIFPDLLSGAREILQRIGLYEGTLHGWLLEEFWKVHEWTHACRPDLPYAVGLLMQSGTLLLFLRLILT
ncbi:MAG: hypothetical protein HYV34_03905 [Candidatus Kerfeldbacteria bacterium]|nr:hypothetical protein [Candidatus Kerfeldbacteria bacterium]